MNFLSEHGVKRIALLRQLYYSVVVHLVLCIEGI